MIKCPNCNSDTIEMDIVSEVQEGYYCDTCGTATLVGSFNGETYTDSYSRKSFGELNAEKLKSIPCPQISGIKRNG